MSIKVQKSPQEFPVSKFPIDIVNVGPRDARCAARERYIARRFALSPYLAAAVASLVFGEARQ